MTPDQVAVFIEERKWDYRSMLSLPDARRHADRFTVAFGFTAAILEGLPVIGLVFTISNRIGAAMWAVGEFSSCLVPSFLHCRDRLGEEATLRCRAESAAEAAVTRTLPRASDIWLRCNRLRLSLQILHACEAGMKYKTMKTTLLCAIGLLRYLLRYNRCVSRIMIENKYHAKMDRGSRRTLQSLSEIFARFSPCGRA